jgi:hypothetical protein
MPQGHRPSRAARQGRQFARSTTARGVLGDCAGHLCATWVDTLSPEAIG